MSTLTAFIAFLVLTVVLLVGVVATGLRARRRIHIPLVVLTVLSLAGTIWFAEKLGKLYDLDAAGRIKDVHLFLAKATTAAYLLPITTGVMTVRRARFRRLHRRVAFTVLALTVVTLVTG
ncbi:MAG: hypothetical protein O7B99_02285, partial [Planctomycetota bacterium]|nr:hypothetical protein [Planctomycetota bacterium]